MREAPAVSEVFALDHIVVIATSLEAGALWVEDCLGVAPLPGGRHREMGTHNLVLRLGHSVYLEVIAVDPEAAAPTGFKRWFGLDDKERVRSEFKKGRGLRAWVARCDNFADARSRLGAKFGEAMRMTRDGRTWTFGVIADGGMPFDGAMPHLIEWDENGSPVVDMPDRGCRLLSLAIEAPAGRLMEKAMRRYELPPVPVREGRRARIFAAIDTPHGVRILT
jgi:hypothetical protein